MRYISLCGSSEEVAQEVASILAKYGRSSPWATAAGRSEFNAWNDIFMNGCYVPVFIFDSVT